MFFNSIFLVKPLEEIYLTTITGTAVMVSLAVLIVIVILRYQNRLSRHLEEVEELKKIYDQEVLKAKLEIKEQTMQEIAGEIHDNIGQTLSLVKLNLHTISDEWDFKKLEASKELVGQAIEDLRNISKFLSPDYIFQLNLMEAVRLILDRIHKTKVCRTRLSITGEEISLEAQKNLIIFRMIQEILNNTIKHAKADRIEVYMHYRPENLFVIIQDDGIGFDLSQLKNSGVGILNLNHRAKLLEGSINIESQLQRGTKVEMFFPYNN